MARKLKVDFTDVESFVRCEEGEHVVALHEIEEKVSSTGNDMLAVTFKVVKGESTGATLYDNFVLTDKALWKFKSYLEVVNVKADGKIALDLDKLIGKRCSVLVKHEEYNGQLRARIEDYKKIKAAPEPEEPEEEEEEEEEEEAPKAAPKKAAAKKSKAKKPEPEEEEDEEEEDDWEDA